MEDSYKIYLQESGGLNKTTNLKNKNNRNNKKNRITSKIKRIKNESTVYDILSNILL